MKIVFIGAGNVAETYASILTNSQNKVSCSDLEIVQVYSRKIYTAQKLIEKYNIKTAIAVSRISDITTKHVDIYLFMLPDDVLPDIVAQMKSSSSVFVHTSGSTNINIFKEKTDFAGVLYPLQSLNKINICDKIEMMLLETSNYSSEFKFNSQLLLLAEKLSNFVYPLNSEERKKVHIAAVFATNFANFCKTLSVEYLQQNINNVELTEKFVEKFLKLDDLPFNLQTGPARRNDRKIIDNHLKMLENNEKFYEIYKIISENIIKTYHK
jgi:predicted short-subunit dehydrogenase-like oxidoreductase (DUF2520 family)